MSSVKHPYFGTLNSLNSHGLDVVWEGKIAINNTETDAMVWIEGNTSFQMAQLDAFAALLTNISSVDARARIQLCNHLTRDDPYYLEYHVNELAESPVIAELIRASAEGIPSADAFVQKMRLHNIGLWHGQKTPLILDYMIDSDYSDDILAVGISLDGEAIYVSWES
ncbi:DUF2004 domain-containing protein [Buttiauxella sp. 3AFRM03]|uniref:DUF2004 domain-containing protein n=1 Tax=Buttiauxella sp. 3AFRM03 TaxID=2479367 RepID=UPI000EF7BE08|nr:DUF2004 domain-containing protein [Buttiauxella sp. 3AFRM03]AYN26717.1 DUF2004 domain-containing protein [Buttiauxella sp. 3AFRM03]